MKMLNYKYYMLPGILVILVTAIGFLLAGLNMVREKEIGTIEQINVTPVRKYQFIIAKMVPFLIIGLIDLAIGLIDRQSLLSTYLLKGAYCLMFLWCSYFSDSCARAGSFYFNILVNPAAVYVRCFLLYDNIYTDERNIHPL